MSKVNGEAWQKHRRLTAPSFNENLSTTVWQEATRQAGQMLQEWINHGARGITTSADDTAKLALNVLTYAGMGVPNEFSEEDGTENNRKLIPPPHELSYRDALNTVLRNFPLLMVFPKKFFNYSFLPASFRSIGKARNEFELYLKELVQEGKKKAKGSKHQEVLGDQSGVENLLQALVRASETASEETGSEKAPSGRAGLADDELYGNLFIYNMGTYSHLLLLLSTYIYRSISRSKNILLTIDPPQPAMKPQLTPWPQRSLISPQNPNGKTGSTKNCNKQYPSLALIHKIGTTRTSIRA